MTKDVQREIYVQMLREAIKERPNGWYATQVCTNCMNYLTAPHGDIKTAKIVTVCPYCYDGKGE